MPTIKPSVKPARKAAAPAAAGDTSDIHQKIPLRGAPLPKALAACADQLYAAQQQRYALNKVAEQLEQREIELRAHLLAQLPKNDSTGIAGKLARVTRDSKDIEIVYDWPKFSRWVVKEAAKDPALLTTFLQKRANGTAIRERYAGSKKFKDVVPGTELGTAPVLRINKV